MFRSDIGLVQGKDKQSLHGDLFVGAARFSRKITHAGPGMGPWKVFPPQTRVKFHS